MTKKDNFSRSAISYDFIEKKCCTLLNKIKILNDYFTMCAQRNVVIQEYKHNRNSKLRDRNYVNCNYYTQVSNDLYLLLK